MDTIPKSEQTRSRILATGRRLVLGTGFTGMGLKELLTESAVPKGSFYHYFASKEAFGQALLEDYVDDYLERVDRLVAAPLSGGERLMAYCGAWLAAADKPSIAETCLVVKLASEIADLSEDMRTTLDAGVTQLVVRLEQIIVAGMADGSIAPQGDPTRAARVSYAQWLGAAILSKLGKSEAPLIEAMDDTRQRFLLSTIPTPVLKTTRHQKELAMRAAIYETFGNPSDVTKLGDVPQPTPGKGEVRIRTILSPIHNHDLWTTRGTYGYKPTLPAIGGTEAVGTVDAVGEGVDAALVGKRVAVGGVQGSWAEYFNAPANGIVPLPDAIADEAAAQLIAMPFSAISLLDMLKAKAGDWIVQTAANGAVGKVMAALTAERGIGLINLVRRPEAVAELIEQGMTHVIATSNADWIDQVKAITGPKGAVSAVDSVGGEVGAALIDVLGTDGELVIFGTATGAPMPLNSGAVIFKEITIKGFWGAKVSAAMSGEKKGQLIGELITMAVKGKLPLPVGGIFDLADAAKAMDAAQVPGRPGKVLLRA